MNDHKSAQGAPMTNNTPEPASSLDEIRQNIVNCFYDELMSDHSEDDIELFDTKQVIDRIVAYTARAVAAARIDELTRLDVETEHHVYVERDGYLKARLAQLASLQDNQGASDV